MKDTQKYIERGSDVMTSYRHGDYDVTESVKSLGVTLLSGRFRNFHYCILLDYVISGLNKQHYVVHSKKSEVQSDPGLILLKLSKDNSLQFNQTNNKKFI